MPRSCVQFGRRWWLLTFLGHQSDSIFLQRRAWRA
eukprot:TCALIF_12168-PA protein Name:"Protein of unknown function" AED:0.00 eAED:0.00 QI:22/1/1/1/0/0.33/3/86/34